LSAHQLHDLAVEAFRIGNRGKLSLCDALRVLAETRLYFDLGFPGICAYAGAFFQLCRAETFEHVRVATALVELTELRDAFAEGRIGWSVLKAITRVASVATQASWIDFSREHGAESTLAETRDAARAGRDAPRGRSFGLPNLDQKLVLRFSRSDMDKVRAWIEGTCARIVEKTGAEDISAEQAILFLCETGLAVAPDGSTGPLGDANSEEGQHVAVGPRARAAYPAQIVYQRCPDCNRGRVGTREGFVELDTEELERHEGCAEPVVVDGPTPPALRRRILAREADRCGNPRCHHRADHCHHIVFRSEGGKTELSNEVAVCATCHALIHAGLLRVTRDADGALGGCP
jgi:5-methylcytosine-specific restriction endonuclease McrA